ncbi:CFEM domain-containing protein [Pochonia chlamydosporia 170]|uniref:CFEM domain-containing protein n=1 Tax=Pochonia chlamydosporia 170 TaxID=1380566 RepID=A0A179EXI5_METCM|nr:CFEM domain-containing protein [Pochonia chlamydosporia 170]OAQ57563.2 CFEM domain-containing protein [Pochonia chlamydosporia 170]
MMAIMYFFAAIAQLTPALAQGLRATDLPACAELRLADALVTSNCSINSVGCLCVDAALHAGVITCARHKCKPKDTLVTVNLTSIAYDAPIQDESPKVVQLSIAFACVTSVIVCLRLFQRVWLGKGLYLDDYTIMVSFVSSCTTFIASYPTNKRGYCKIFKIASTVLLAINCRCRTYRIPSYQIMRRLIVATMAVTVSFLIVFSIIAIFQCKPIAYYWTGWDGETKGYCLNVNALPWVSAAASILLDLWMLGLPLSQLKQLPLHWTKKIRATWDNVPITYWSAVELNVSIWCACMPSMRLLLNHLFSSTRDRLHNSAISLSRHRRAIEPSNPDPSLAIIHLRGFQIEYSNKCEASTRELPA